jgi:hypothetical protein
MLPYPSQQQFSPGSVATSACTMQAQHQPTSPVDKQLKFGTLSPTHVSAYCVQVFIYVNGYTRYIH